LDHARTNFRISHMAEAVEQTYQRWLGQRRGGAAD
jgi:hypothetical protein